MSKAHLYVNSKGYEVRSHSYSGGDTFHFCARKYKLQRVDGWKEKKQTAAQQFGIAFESALRFYHENGRDVLAGVNEFVRLWTENIGKEMSYSAVERDWDSLLLTGQELMRLYHVRLPSFPLDVDFTPKFQVKYVKELFPGTEWAGIEFVAYVDMLCHSSASLGDQIIVDIKTSGAGIDPTPGILALDQQLRTYAWVTGVSDVAFLPFQKVGRSLERGDWISLLDTVGEFKAGSKAVLIKFQEFEEAQPEVPADPFKTRSKPKPAVPEVPEEIWIVKTEKIIEQMFAECGKGQTKVEKEAREIFARQYGTLVLRTSITKQRVDFRSAHIGLTEQTEVAEQIRRDVGAIVQANKDNFWPQQGGVRFPNNKCVMCPMRGICLDNKELRDQLVERTDEEWQVKGEDSEN